MKKVLLLMALTNFAFAHFELGIPDPTAPKPMSGYSTYHSHSDGVRVKIFGDAAKAIFQHMNWQQQYGSELRCKRQYDMTLRRGSRNRPVGVVHHCTIELATADVIKEASGQIMAYSASRTNPYLTLIIKGGTARALQNLDLLGYKYKCAESTCRLQLTVNGELVPENNEN